MAHTKIATAAPFEGAPRINAPAMFGASPDKPILYRIPVAGKRPMAISVENLPEGLNLDDRGILTGKLPEGDYQLTLKAENELGKAEKQICFEIHPDHLLLTPLLGFTTWNAFQSTVRQEDVERSAKYLSETGLSEYGYCYINIDSGWQGQYGGELDAIQPNAKFTDMKAMTDLVHSYGFKSGIYSTPMRNAWGCPAELESIPGCTRGDIDIRLSREAFGFGVERMEANNAAQWNQWGFDYLKYDWVPNEGFSADLMKQQLLKQDRDFAFCITVLCKPEYADYWKRNCNSWRNNPDSGPEWNIVKDIFKTYDPWIPHVGKGHFFDMDMLELGESVRNEGVCQLTEDEQIFAFTMRAFLMTPIQLSSMLDKLSQFELNLYGNEEILAIHQDPLTSAATLKQEVQEGDTWLKIYRRELADGNVAEAFFNAGETEQTVALETELGEIRDVWAREMLEETSLTLPPHSVRVIKYIR